MKVFSPKQKDPALFRLNTFKQPEEAPVLPKVNTSALHQADPAADEGAEVQEPAIFRLRNSLYEKMKRFFEYDKVY